jgi:DNA polymerase (family 10)
MLNFELAKLFYDLADILEARGVQWKPAAYRKAARSIESLQEPIEDIYQEKGIKALEDMPGIGERIAEKIIE